MKNLLTFIFAIIQINFAQTATVDLENGRKDGDKFKFDVSITRTSIWSDGTGLANYLGSSSFRFSYNSDGLSNDPSIDAVGPQFPSDYSITAAIISEQINVEVNFAFNFNSSPLVLSSKYLLFTFAITIQDENELAGISWVPSSTAVFDGKDENVISTLNGDLSCTPFPVELTAFTANYIEGIQVKLQWETATEVDNYGFEILRCTCKDRHSDKETKKQSWEKIGFVEGHGNSNSPKSYSFIDNNLVGNSIFLYRLKQIDSDGKFEYSYAVEVEVVPDNYKLYQNYPNPFNPLTNIIFALPKDSKVIINIYDLLGAKIVELVNMEFPAGFHQIEFSASPAELASGVYLYSFETKEFNAVKKMILFK